MKLLHQYAYRFPRQSSQLEIDLSNSCGLEKPVEVCNLPAISSLRTEGEQGTLFCAGEGDEEGCQTHRDFLACDSPVLIVEAHEDHRVLLDVDR